MASSATYQSPSMGSTGSWGWKTNPSLQQDHHLNQLSKEKYVRNQNTSKCCHQQKRSQIKTNSSELQNNILGSTKNIIQIGGGSKGKSVFRNSEKLNYFVEPELMNPVNKISDILISKLPSQANFGKEIKQPCPSFLSRPEISSCQLPIQSGQQKIRKIAHKPVNLNSKLSKVINQPIAKPLKDAMCFLCCQNIKEYHFEEHLFFGTVRCTQCYEEILDCYQFQLMIVNSKMGIMSCKHSLQYCMDPFDYISAKLLDDSTGCMNGSVVPSYVLNKLSLYVGILDVLENKDPWKSAIFICKTFLPSVVTKPLENIKTLSNSNTDIVKSIPVTLLQENSYSMEKGKLYTCGKDRLDTMGKKTFHDTKGFEIRQDICSPMKHNCYKRQITEDDVEDVLLSRKYGFEHLEESVGYVEVADYWKLPYSKSVKKPRPHKKWKGIKSDLSPMVTEKDQPEEQTTEHNETPAKGYYYVVRQAIEECPMCYTVLCPSEFTVNVNTFLMTTVCSYCFLTIYIVLESPDGVSIVTEGSIKSQQPSSSIENKNNGNI